MSLRIAAAACLFVLLRGPLWPQSDMGTLWGVVQDSEGKPLEGMTVYVADVITNVVVRRCVTDSAGRYEAPYLRPGIYYILIEETGYQAFEADGIRLEPGEVRRFDARLTPGDPAQSNRTRAENPPIRFFGTHTGSVVEYKGRWMDAPQADRHPTLFPLLSTAPGVQGVEAGVVISGVSSRRQQSWVLDGVPDNASNQTLNPLVTDVVEVRLANPDVTSALPAGLVMVSRRGSEAMHGMMFYKHTSPPFNARSFFDTQDASYRMREAGGELAWDLIPDYTWLYGGGMYQRLLYQQTFSATVPTSRMRDGDLGLYLDPETAPNGKVVIVRDPRTGLPFPRNLIPITRIQTVSRNYILSYYPLPNAGERLPENYLWLHRFGPDTYNGNWPLGRWDQRVTSQRTFYMRWLQNQTASVVPGSIGRPLDATRTWRYRSLVFSDVHAFRSNLVNHLTMARNRLRIKQGESEADVDPPRGNSVVTTLNLQGVNPQGFEAMGFPNLTLPGLTGLIMAHGGGEKKDVAHHDGSFVFRDSLSWIRGRHSIKGGIDYTRYFFQNGEVPLAVYGAFTFSGAYTGLPYGDFLLGYPATSSRQTAQVNRLIRQHQLGLYLADSFRVNSRLTLDYGLRWDYYGTPVYKDGKMANWDPATGNVVVAPGTYTLVSLYYPKNINVVVGDVVPKPKRDNIRPRLGWAFRLTANTALRAGYGEFTENPGYGEDGRLPNTNPFWLKETYTNWIPATLPALSFPRPFPTNPLLVPFPAQSVTAVPMKTEEGRIRQLNLTLERLLGPAVLNVSYVGFRGLNMNYVLDVNKPPAGAIPFRNERRPYPQFGAAHRYRNDGQWKYDSLVARVRNRRGPVQVDSAFTWSNNLANYLNTLDPYHVTNQWTRDGATRRLYSVTTASWPLPVGRGRKLLGKAGRWSNLALGNWTLHAIATFASGQYYSPWFTGPDPANTSPGYVTLLPDCVGNPNAGARNRNLWFNPAAFAIPPAGAGRYGTCGMNVLEGYPIHVAHVSFTKQIPLGETLRAVFTAHISNITNTPHFNFPQSNLSEPNPGRFTASSRVTDANPVQQGPRQIMVKLRVEF